MNLSSLKLLRPLSLYYIILPLVPYNGPDVIFSKIMLLCITCDKLITMAMGNDLYLDLSLHSFLIWDNPLSFGICHLMFPVNYTMHISIISLK